MTTIVELTTGAPTIVELEVAVGTSEVTLTDATATVVNITGVEAAGPPGPPGADGAPGPTGPQGPPGAGSAASYLHVQSVPASTWTITHNLGFLPNVTVIDSANSQVEGDVAYIDVNSLTVTFSGAFAGEASLT